MYFNSHIFILAFLPITILGYFLINRTKKYKLGLLWLSAASLVFIGYLNVFHIFVTICSVAIGYLFIHLVSRERFINGNRKRFLTAGILFHIFVLFYFKYYNFFIDNINVLLKKEFPLLNILLPLGISFYTFQQIAYLVDCYREPEIRCGFTEYFLFVTYFPKFLQGPILLHGDMIPYIRDEKYKSFSAEEFSKGLYAFALGLGKKVLIADCIALLVNAGYGNIGDLNCLSTIVVMVAYSLQLYYDFSGYCDMAMGIGLMLRIPVPVNFNSPYKAVSVTDIWARWHMTLTRFFTRYVYIPLGGNRKGRTRMYVNTFVVFVLSGIWHGAAWTFIIWGLLHAFAMVVSKFIADCKIVLPKVIGWMGTFAFWITSFAIFRADNMKDAMELFSRIFIGGWGKMNSYLYEAIFKQAEISILQRMDIWGFMDRYPDVFAGILLMISLLGCLCMKNTQKKLEEFQFTYSKMLVTFILLFYGILSMGKVTVFLYANF